MPTHDRLSALDSAFLHVEDDSTAHMHLASVMIFDGRAPSYDELVEHVAGRMQLLPRYRQRLAAVPYGQGRPVWADDPRFDLRYHIRLTALPKPADASALKALTGRIISARLDRTRPLWEIWLVQRLAGNRFAMIAKAHHALLDGVASVDIATALLDGGSEPAAAPPPWVAQPLPGPAKLLGEALLERATAPVELARGVRALVRDPRQALARARSDLTSVGAATLAGISSPAPPSPFNVDIGPHRRYTWVDAELVRVLAIKAALDTTINDVVLAAVCLALGGYLRARGIDTEQLVLKALVPVSVRTEAERGTLGNRVAAMWVPLPVGVIDAAECLVQIHASTLQSKGSGQAQGAQVLTRLAAFAPLPLLIQAARLQARQRFFNLVVTNVRGPQVALHMLGHRLTAIYPVVPLARRQALGVAVVSYDGHLSFGLSGDFDTMPDLEQLGVRLERALTELAVAAGLPSTAAPSTARPTRGRRDRARTATPSAAASERARRTATAVTRD
jgi:WS/DGAT/MGAT family acyltransferase